MEAFNVAPFDQNLSLNGRYLRDSGKTLGYYRVLPESKIYLKADESNTSFSKVVSEDGVRGFEGN